MLLHQEVSSMGGQEEVKSRTHRSHDMGGVADNDYFAVHILRDWVSDQERILEDPFFRSIPIRESVK